MDVFSKFGVDGLERCLEAEAFAGREISGEDDLLDVVIGELVDIEVTRQPSSSSAIGVFDAAFLPGGIGVAEPGRHIAHGSQQRMLGEGGVIVEGDGLA